VLLEAGIQVGLKTIANDVLVAEAVSRGTLQICEFLPLAALALLESLDILAAFDLKFAAHVDKIQADETACRAGLEGHPTLLTAFLPLLGYEKAEALALEFEKAGGNLRAFLEARLGKDTVDKTLSPARLMSLGYDDE
jgi:aspartate ammonia-lyase